MAIKAYDSGVKALHKLVVKQRYIWPITEQQVIAPLKVRYYAITSGLEACRSENIGDKEATSTTCSGCQTQNPPVLPCS